MGIHREDSVDENEKESLMNRIKGAKPMTQIICVIGLVLFVYAGYMFVSQLSDYFRASKTYENTAKDYVITKQDENTGEEMPNWEELVDVDLSGLIEENPDIIGWIYFENVDINYPVLQSEDNSTYLRKMYTGQTSSAGSIFMEKENDSDFSDAHTIIYGHNMKDHTMFGKLRNYIADEDYVKNHEYFQIITEKEKYRYKICSYKVVADDSNVYTIYKEGGQDFVDFAKEEIQNGSYLVTEDNVNADDHLITLSTCINDDRLVVTAIRCDEFLLY